MQRSTRPPSGFIVALHDRYPWRQLAEVARRFARLSGYQSSIPPGICILSNCPQEWTKPRCLADFDSSLNVSAGVVLAKDRPTSRQPHGTYGAMLRSRHAPDGYSMKSSTTDGKPGRQRRPPTFDRRPRVFRSREESFSLTMMKRRMFVARVPDADCDRNTAPRRRALYKKRRGRVRGRFGR